MTMIKTVSTKIWELTGKHVAAREPPVFRERFFWANVDQHQRLVLHALPQALFVDCFVIICQLNTHTHTRSLVKFIKSWMIWGYILSTIKCLLLFLGWGRASSLSVSTSPSTSSSSPKSDWITGCPITNKALDNTTQISSLARTLKPIAYCARSSSSTCCVK
jgi:hypothetical protein